MEFEKKVIELDVNDVLPNRFQPRIKFNEDSINELSDSIKEHGVIQPIVVRTMGDKYEIIAGERRYKASLLAGKTTIPAVVTNLNDKDSAEVALIENVQRKDLTPIEEAISYKKILDMGYLTQEELAVKLGKSQSTVANKLRLLNLDESVQEAVLDEKISERHARSLLKLTDLSEQRNLLEKIINERLTVRKTDEEINKILNKSDDNDVSDSTVNVLKPTYVENPFKVKRVEGNMNSNQNIIEEPVLILDETTQIPAVAEDDISLTGESVFDVPSMPIEEQAYGIPQNTSEINPGFMNIDKIESSAKDFLPEEKEPANIDSLLKPSPEIAAISAQEKEAEVAVEEESVDLVEGKFFTLPTDDDSTSLNDNNNNQESIENQENVSVNSVSPFDFQFTSTPSVEAPKVQTPTIETPVMETQNTMPTSQVDVSIPSEVPINNPIDTNMATADEFLNLGNDNINESINEGIPNDAEQLDVPVESDGVGPAEDGIVLALNDIRDFVSSLENRGFIVDTDEVDFETEYQVTIKIKK